MRKMSNMASSSPKILIIDDEAKIRKLLRITLEADGFQIEEADKGEQGIFLAASVKPDLVILDLGLPDIDGLEVIPKIREFAEVPIIVLSVRDQDDTIVTALDNGADDYVTKPFNSGVLLARIKANLRRSAKQDSGGQEVITNGPIKMDLVRHEAFLGDQKLNLSPREYQLLRHFMANKGKMLTHQQLLEKVWGKAHTDNPQYLRVYVGQLRQLIEETTADPKIIVTEPGIGYRMENLESTTNSVTDRLSVPAE
jgi:two-component system KDP operon response regulator KdpE